MPSSRTGMHALTPGAGGAGNGQGQAPHEQHPSPRPPAKRPGHQGATEGDETSPRKRCGIPTQMACVVCTADQAASHVASHAWMHGQRSLSVRHHGIQQPDITGYNIGQITAHMLSTTYLATARLVPALLTGNSCQRMAEHGCYRKQKAYDHS